MVCMFVRTELPMLFAILVWVNRLLSRKNRWDCSSPIDGMLPNHVFSSVLRTWSIMTIFDIRNNVYKDGKIKKIIRPFSV